MFRKVLLLVLVCVAASEVCENDLQCQTEEGLKQANTIFHALSNNIHNTMEIYSNGYLGFYKTCEAYWGIIWNYANEEVKEVENASLELTETATEQNSPEEVFTCISEMTQRANEVLKVIPWTFDTRLQGEARRYHDDHFRIASTAYEYMRSYVDHYWKDIVANIKECDTNECIEEILNKYEAEYEEKSEILAGIVQKLDAHVAEFKTLAETMLSGVRGTFRYARIAGVDDLKKCLTVSA